MLQQGRYVNLTPPDIELRFTEQNWRFVTYFWSFCWSFVNEDTLQGACNDAKGSQRPVHHVHAFCVTPLQWQSIAFMAS